MPDRRVALTPAIPFAGVLRKVYHAKQKCPRENLSPRGHSMRVWKDERSSGKVHGLAPGRPSVWLHRPAPDDILEKTEDDHTDHNGQNGEKELACYHHREHGDGKRQRDRQEEDKKSLPPSRSALFIHDVLPWAKPTSLFRFHACLARVCEVLLKDR